jgi:glycerol-3-phosphate dehydrogenase
LYLIGTTDLRYDGDLEHVEAGEAEIDYLLSETNRLIPAARLTRDAIAYTYSGIRPLAYEGDRAEKGITRRHFIHDHSPHVEGLLSIVGGKLTTYRRLAEQTVNLLYKKLGRTAPRCRTMVVALPGALCDGAEDFSTFSERFIGRSTLPRAISERLLRVYGTRATLALKLIAEHPELAQPLSSTGGAIGAEVLMAFEHEMALSLTDCLLRRTMAGLDAAAGIGADEAAARVARKYLGWSEERAARELDAYRAYVRRFHPRALRA